MRNLAKLLCTLFCLSQCTSIDPSKAVVCLTLSKLRFQEPSAVFQLSLEVPGIQYEQLFGKLLSSMTLHCYDHINTEEITEALESELEGEMSLRLKALTPMPEEPLCAMEDVEMSEDDRTRFVQVVEAVQEESQRTDGHEGQKM